MISPLAGAAASRISENAVMTNVAALMLTPKSRAYCGSTGATTPYPRAITTLAVINTQTSLGSFGFSGAGQSAASASELTGSTLWDDRIRVLVDRTWCRAEGSLRTRDLDQPTAITVITCAVGPCDRRGGYRGERSSTVRRRLHGVPRRGCRSTHHRAGRGNRARLAVRTHRSRRWTAGPHSHRRVARSSRRGDTAGSVAVVRRWTAVDLRASVAAEGDPAR